jgi:hypothetical protein
MLRGRVVEALGDLPLSRVAAAHAPGAESEEVAATVGRRATDKRDRGLVLQPVATRVS